MKVSLEKYTSKYSDGESAKNLGISRSTLLRWRNHPQEGHEVMIEVESFRAVSIIQIFKTDIAAGQKLPTRQPTKRNEDETEHSTKFI